MNKCTVKLWQKLLFICLLFLVSQQLFAQVRGKVSDSGGMSIPGSTIQEKGTNNGTITDAEGKYQIKVSNPQTAVLVFSFVGMETQEIPVSGRTTLNVTLGESNVKIDDVVVVGYGSQKKASVVAAISTINSTELVRSTTANLTIGLAGKMPGLTIMVKDGELGKESIQSFIRGQATLNSSAPLILVDGIQRDMYSLSAYDIESVSILKDASATAVFGVRGANGVIIVTTKRGLIGKPVVTANVNYSLQTPTFLVKPLGAIDYMNTRNQVVHMNDSTATLPFSPAVFQHYKDGDLPNYYVDRNWYKEFMYKYTPMQTNQVNIRGGNETTKYFASVGYMHQGGPFKTERWSEYNYDNSEHLDRFTYRANIDMQITKTLKGWVNLSGYLQDKNDPIVYGGIADAATTGDYYYLLLAEFTDFPSISMGDLTPTGGIVSAGPDRVPYGALNRTGYRITTTNSINTTVGFEQDLSMLTKGLSARAVVAYDPLATHIRGFRRTYQTYVPNLTKTTAGKDTVTYLLGTGVDTQLSSQLQQNLSTSYDLEASLNYNNTFGKHAVTGLLLYKQNQKIIDVQVPYNYLGIVGRLTYSYANRYLAEANFGYNGSEQFAPGKRFGFFPSFSAGWVISEEGFMKSSEAIQFLKIRGSYGQVGNDQISGSRFIYVDNWTQGTAGYFDGLANVPGLPNPVYQASIPNPNVSWEVANKYNFGFESKFLRGFGFDFDVFYEKRSSILLTRSLIPAYMFGQTSLPPTNTGVMDNKGFEATLSYQKQVNHDLFIRTNFSISFAKNNVIKANEVANDSTFAYSHRIEGYPIGVQWGYHCLGYFRDQADINGSPSQKSLGSTVLPGDLKYADLNHDGIIDTKDQMPMKYPSVPNLNLAYSFSASYKGFDLSVLLQGVADYDYNFSGRGIQDYSGNAVNGLQNYFENNLYAWTPEKAANGGDIRYPRMHTDGNTCSKQSSDYWHINLWYMRVKNVELGYTFNKKWSSKIGMSDLRIYFNALNMMTFSNMPFKILDPEVSNSLNHPISKNFTLGVNISF